MSEIEPQITADVSKQITTIYRDGVSNHILYVKTEPEQFIQQGKGTYYTRAVEETELNLNLLKQDAERQKREIHRLVKVPIRTRLAGYVLTACGVYGAKEAIHDSFTQHNKFGLGIIALAGIGITEGVTAFRRHDSRDQVKFYEETYNAQQFHIRRLTAQRDPKGVPINTVRDHGHIDTGL